MHTAQLPQECGPDTAAWDPSVWGRYLRYCISEYSYISIIYVIYLICIDICLFLYLLYPRLGAISRFLPLCEDSKIPSDSGVPPELPGAPNNQKSNFHVATCRNLRWCVDWKLIVSYCFYNEHINVFHVICVPCFYTKAHTSSWPYWHNNDPALFENCSEGVHRFALPKTITRRPWTSVVCCWPFLKWSLWAFDSSQLRKVDFVLKNKLTLWSCWSDATRRIKKNIWCMMIQWWSMYLYSISICISHRFEIWMLKITSCQTLVARGPATQSNCAKSRSKLERVLTNWTAVILFVNVQ